MLKQYTEARTAEPNHYINVPEWPWFKESWPCCFLQLWFLFAAPPTVRIAQISLTFTAKWTE